MQIYWACIIYYYFQEKSTQLTFFASLYRKHWRYTLWSKNKFVDIFQIWLPDVEVEVEYLMKALKINKRGEFILIKFKIYYQ